MSDMQFSTPESVNAAVSLLENDNEANVLAGGTDLIVQLQAGLRKTRHIVDIKRIPELNAVTHNTDGTWTLGAAVCSAELNENKKLKAQWPGVLEAADLIGSMQVQGRATIAGNLCNASPAADSVPALVAANASVTIAGPNGRRTATIDTIGIAPGKTSLEAGEIIVSINLPTKPVGSGEAYSRFIPRSEMDIAVVGVGVFLVLDNTGVCTDARVALGAVAPTVLSFNKTHDILVGEKPDNQTLEKTAQVLMNACQPIDDKRGTAEYRKDIVGVLFKRTAQIAIERASA